MADIPSTGDPTRDELNREMLESLDQIPIPGPSDDSFYETAGSAHVTLTTGRDPGVQSVSGLEGLGDLLSGIATGVVTVTKNVTEKKPPQQPVPPPKTEQPHPPPVQQPPSVQVLVGSGAPVASSTSKAPVIVASVVGGVALVGVFAYLASRPSRRIP